LLKTNHDPAQTPVLIVGAGPTGLTLACDLARRGINLRIIDKSPVHFAGSRGKGLQPRTLELLDDLGLIDEILANGRFHLPFRGYDGATILGDKDIHEGRHPTPAVPYASSLIIPQFRVEEILRKRLAAWGIEVELARELIDIAQDDATVTATLLRDDLQHQVTAQYVVAADGGRSFLRKHLNVGFEGETWKDERMLVGDVRVDVLDRDHWHSWPKHKDGWVALCPLPSTRSFQFQAQIPPDEPDEPSLARFQQIIDERTGMPAIRLYDATWLSLYRANVRMVDRYRVGRIFLAGDAAHVHSPAGGQGMNTGMQDAYNFGWKLSAVLSGAPASLLDTYEEERLPIAAWLLGATTKLHRQILQSNADLLRDDQFLQLKLNYRGASLSQGEPTHSSTLQPGDRARRPTAEPFGKRSPPLRSLPRPPLHSPAVPRQRRRDLERIRTQRPQLYDSPPIQWTAAGTPIHRPRGAHLEHLRHRIRRALLNPPRRLHRLYYKHGKCLPGQGLFAEMQL
jgi:2-polyprenyl-6-methoxyphenol hydroxylase-like FAD-dependent oxidoreductase